MTYLEQAIEVTGSDEDRAAMLEQAGDAASIGAQPTGDSRASSRRRRSASGLVTTAPWRG